MMVKIVLSLFQMSEEAIYWKASHSSSFFLSAEKTRIKSEEELLAFDFEDLVNGLGGALGLFLGWSLLYISNQLVNAFMFIRDRVEDMCKIKLG